MSQAVLGRLPSPDRWALPLAGGAVALVAGAVVGLGGNPLFYASILCLMVAAFTIPRVGVVMVVVITVVEGYVRNRLGNPQVLLVKDFVLAAVYMRFFGERMLRGQRIVPATPLDWAAALFAGVVLVQTLNPHQVSAEVALVGVRTWIFYIPLFYVGWELFGSSPWRGRLSAVLIGVAVPACLVAIAQLAAGPDAYARQGDAFHDATFVTTVGQSSVDLFRPNSTFSWSAHFATFVAVVTLCVLGVLLGVRGKFGLVLAGILSLLIGVDVLEAQRTFWILLPPLMVLAVALSGRFRGVGRLAFAIAASLLVLGIVAQASEYGQSALVRVSDLLLGRPAVEFADRMAGYLYFMQSSVTVSPIGLGAGASVNGSRYLSGNVPLFLEFSLARVIADLSLLGLAAYLFMMATLMRASGALLKDAKEAGNAPLVGVAAALLSLVVLMVYWGYDLGIAAVLFWLLAGAGLGAARELSQAAESSHVAVPPQHDQAPWIPAPLATH